MHRAAHQLLDRPPVLDDPLALRIIGKQAEARVREAVADPAGNGSSGLRLFVATRSRFSEDTLAEAFERGTRQYVLLGAGLDTFAYRAAKTFPGLRVFEVDHPATQAFKRTMLAEAGLDPPQALAFAPVNFETETLAGGLSRAGFDAGQSAVFAWLGVVPYLSREAILATLRMIARLARGTIVVFDYGEPADSRDERRHAMQEALAARVAAAGEPFRSHFVPEEMKGYVLALGFSRAEDFDADVLNGRYFSGRPDGLMLRGRGHLMRAEV